MSKRRKQRRDPRAWRRGWNVYLATGTRKPDTVQLMELSEDEARAEVRRLNAGLDVETVLSGHFYYCHHGNYVRSPRDKGLDQWLDGKDK